MNAARHLSRSPEETRAIARTFVREVRAGEVILLHGDLGLGKTCFVQGLAEGLGWTGPVVSPTFSLIQEYETQPPLAHADLYRLEAPGAVHSLGLDELSEDGFILAIEWPSRCPGLWPADAWHIRLDTVPDRDGERSIFLSKGQSPCP